jgi:hypothetical protein
VNLKEVEPPKHVHCYQCHAAIAVIGIDENGAEHNLNIYSAQIPVPAVGPDGRVIHQAYTVPLCPSCKSQIDAAISKIKTPTHNIEMPSKLIGIDGKKII